MFVNVIQRSLPAMKVLMIFMLLLMTLFGSLIYSVRAICAVFLRHACPVGGDKRRVVCSFTLSGAAGE